MVNPDSLSLGKKYAALQTVSYDTEVYIMGD